MRMHELRTLAGAIYPCPRARPRPCLLHCPSTACVLLTLFGLVFFFTMIGLVRRGQLGEVDAVIVEVKRQVLQTRKEGEGRRGAGGGVNKTE